MSKQTVTCPHCRATQSEPTNAVSTNCRSCGGYFKIQLAPQKRIVKTPRQTRAFICRNCGWDCKAVPSALSTQCENCAAYLDLRHHRVSTATSETLSTYGDVEFLTGSSYRGFEVRANRIVVAGRVHAKLRADTEIELAENGSVRGSLQAPLVRIARKAKTMALAVESPILEIHGSLHVRTVEATETLHVFPGGCLLAQKISAARIIVDLGGALQGQLEILPPADSPEREAEAATPIETSAVVGK